MDSPVPPGHSQGQGPCQSGHSLNVKASWCREPAGPEEMIEPSVSCL